MTDATITAVAAPPAAPEGPPPQASEQPKPASTGVEVDHTPGGWPVVPLALTGTNTTASLLAAAALAGGPLAAALAATGAVALGTAAAHRGRTMPGRKRATTPSTGRSARQGIAGRVPRQPKRTAAGTPMTRSPGRGSSTAKPGRTQARPGSLSRGARKATAGTPGTARAGMPRGRVGQVRALREQSRAAAPSRAAQRAETTAARRSVADARRAAKAQARTASLARKGPIGRAVARGTGAAGKARVAAVERLRKARDARAAGQVAQQRSAVRKAPARRKARKALRRSAARFHGRRLLAALLGGVLGMVGLLTTPLGRKLGWAWLQYPGRRLYRRMVASAKDLKAERDQQIRADQDAEEAAVDAEAAEHDAQVIGDRAERPAGLVPAVPTTTSEDVNVSGFNFEEQTAEMESAAQSYEPDSAMEILAMVEGLPQALTSVANVMRILAERADSEFPLEKEVADGFNDIFGALMSAVAVAEDMGPMFRQAHEQDIARHEDPRNGPEAEKGWNV